jgi:hypothetical protein
MKYKLLFILLCAFSSAFAQDILISSASGPVSILTGNSTVAAKKGSQITKTSTLQLKEKATCMIVDTKGRSVYLKSAGNYTYQAIQQFLAKGKEDDLLKGYANLLVKNLFSHGDEGQTSVTTAVHRGNDLMKLPGDNTMLDGGTLTFRWTPPTPKSWVRLTISDRSGVVIDTLFKSDGRQVSTYPVPVSRFKTGMSYTWKAELSPVNKRSGNVYHFLIMDKADMPKLNKEASQLNRKVLDKATRKDLWQYIYTKWENYYKEKQS